MAESTDPNTDTASNGGTNPNTSSSTTTPAAGAPAAGSVDLQAEINKALAAQQTEFAKQLKAATGHDDFKSLQDAQLKEQGKLQELADSKAKEAATYKQQFQQVNIANALLAASGEAVDPSTVSALLSGKAVCDDHGTVTIDGKPVADAVKQLLTDKPFLAKAQGGTGSGAPQHTASVKQVTRADFERLNPTEQFSHIKNGGVVV